MESMNLMLCVAEYNHFPNKVPDGHEYSNLLSFYIAVCINVDDMLNTSSLLLIITYMDWLI